MNAEFHSELNRVVRESQELLLQYLLPDSKMSEKDCINALLGVLDNRDFVRMQRQYGM